ncbi:FG-GAP-like repeat-containing protein [Myxococcota bacterium]|nr:FG-GAP-like repeat-containing protein [Myxococcota bacterium]
MRGRPAVLALAALALAAPRSPAWARDVLSAGISPASVLGDQPSGRLGNVFGPGDLDGDGVDELLVGAPYYEDLGNLRGRAWLFYGGRGRMHRHMAPGQADAWFRGEGTYDYVGWAASRPFDFDGDGHPDLLLGAYQYGDEDIDQGRIYVFLGGGGRRLAGEVPLTDADYIIEGGGRYQRIGFLVQPAGDLDGDGLTDMVIGAPFMGQNPFESQAWLLLTGRWDLSWDPSVPSRAGWPPAPGVIDTTDQAFMVLNGDLTDSETGWSAHGGRDVTGDGLDDLLIGAPRFSGDPTHTYITGKAYLVPGRRLVGSEASPGWDAVQFSAGGQAVLELAFVGGSFLGGALNDRLGQQVAVLPDVAPTGGGTGTDGLAEVLLAAPTAELVAGSGGDAYSAGGDTGVVFCFPGVLGGWTRSQTEAEAGGTIEGGVDGEMLGTAMEIVPDLDGDGVAELLLGAPGGYFGGGGISGVLYQVGAESACAGARSSLDADVAWVGVDEGDLFGRYVAALGDVDGDGSPDFAVGAPSSRLSGEEAGAVWIVGPGLLVDDDGDGLAEVDGDCRDWDAASTPDRGEDRDCDGLSEAAGDCDDGDPRVRPGLAETCDGLDQDCDGDVDEGTDCHDPDGDGYTLLDGDCDEGAPESNIGAPELCDGLDNDCDGVVDDDCGGGCGGCGAVPGGAPVGPAAGLILLAGTLVARRGGTRAVRLALLVVALVALPSGAAYAQAEFRMPAELSMDAARARFTSSQPYMRLYQAAGAGDLDGDGRGELLVVDWRASVGSIGDGIVGIFPGGTEPWGDGTLPVDSDVGFWGSALLDNLGQRLGTQPGVGRAASPGDGDIDGDGYADVLLGAPGNNDEGGDNYGRAWILWGGPDLADWGWREASELETRYDGVEHADRFAKGTALLGDVNGDGYADAAFGAPFTSEALSTLDTGIVYLFLGAPRDDPRWDHGDADERATALIKDSLAQGQFGHDVAPAGDVDGDGLADFLVGQEGWSDPTDGTEGPVAAGTPGRTFLFPGWEIRAAYPPEAPEIQASPPETVFLSSACAAFVGERETDLTSQVIGTLGDVDGDGLDDLFFGAPYATRPVATSDSPYVGRGWIVYGRSVAEGCDGDGQGDVNAANSWTTLEDGRMDVTFEGGAAGDLMGWSFAGLGDVDGDGREDFVVTTPGDDRGGPGTGLALLYLGRDWPTGTTLTADDADAWIPVPGPDDASGIGVAALGDLDGDGRIEFSVGGPVHDEDGYQRGSVWVFSVAHFWDDDGDGASEFEGDCDDADPQVHPSASDPAVDGDCDGVTPGDGDCDDSDADSFPGAIEAEDGADNDCDGRVDEGFPGADLDGDGVTVGEGDCNDADPGIAPGLPETCDGVDEDCDGKADDALCLPDTSCATASGSEWPPRGGVALAVALGLALVGVRRKRGPVT